MNELMKELSFNTTYEVDASAESSLIELFIFERFERGLIVDELMKELSFNTTYEVEASAESGLIEKIAQKIYEALRGNDDYINNHIVVNHGAEYLDVVVFKNSIKGVTPDWLTSEMNFYTFIYNIMSEVALEL